MLRRINMLFIFLIIFFMSYLEVFASTKMYEENFDDQDIDQPSVGYIKAYENFCCIQERMLPVEKEPEDIADVIAFLASDAARYIAGECVEISGAKAVY